MTLYDSSQFINMINTANAYLSSFYPTFNNVANYNSSNPFGPFNNTAYLKPINFSYFGPIWTSPKSSSNTSLHSQMVRDLYSNNDNSSTRYGLGFGNNIVSTAKGYLGYNEANGSYKLFTDGRTEAWCADFVTHCVDETCEKTGRAKPSGFGSPSVSVLRDWGIKNDCYLRTDNKSNKGGLIAQNVKPGDVVIFKNGISHTGIVERVNPDGSFTTIEGNTSDKVARRNYSATDSRVSGFVQLA